MVKRRIRKKILSIHQQGLAQKYTDLTKLSLQKIDTRVLCFIKIGRKEHIESLADGKIYCRHLKHYKDPKYKSEPFYDIHEGLSAVYSAKEVNVKVQGKKLDLDPKTQVVVSYNHKVPAFCLHAMHTGHWTHREFNQKIIPQIKEFLQVPYEMDKFQGHVLLIMDIDAFVKRLAKVCIEKGIGFNADLVRYIDVTRVRGVVHRSKIGFIKQKKHTAEREYRIVFHADEVLEDPFMLDLGSVRDIVQTMSLEEFRKKWKLRFR